jgi:RNA polymerase sigma-70 factor, ECF subfamily
MALNTEQVWESFRERLKHFVLKRVPDTDAAEDLLQEVFVKVHARLHTLQNEEKLEAWLFQITRNVITEHYRKRPKEGIPIGAMMEDETVSVLVAEEPEDEENEAEQLIHSCLLPMMETLSPADQEALRLTEYEKISQKEMSERLNISFSGAKSRVQRARERLKDVLLECCHLEFDRRGNILDYALRSDDCQFCCPDPSKKNSSE